MGVHGTPQFDSLIGRAALLRYDGRIKLTHEWVITAEGPWHQMVLFSFYLAPGEDHLAYALKACRIGKSRFDEIMREIYHALACYLRLNSCC